MSLHCGRNSRSWLMKVQNLWCSRSCGACIPGFWNWKPAGLERLPRKMNAEREFSDCRRAALRGGRYKHFLCWGLVLLGWMASLSFADESATAGRQVLQRYQNAVITVKLILKQGMSYNNQDSKTETKSETTGTIIDPSGLTIISLSAIDPSSPMNRSEERR